MMWQKLSRATSQPVVIEWLEPSSEFNSYLDQLAEFQKQFETVWSVK